MGGACKPTTRLSVMLPALPDVGIWRLEVHGWYAATELMGSLHLARLSGTPIVEARLRLEQREQKKPGKPTMQYGVPVLELPGMSVAALLGGGAAAQVGPGVTTQVPERVNRRERVARPPLPPGPPPPTDRAFTPHGGGAAQSVPPPPPLPDEPPHPALDTERTVTTDGEIIEAEVVEDDLVHRLMRAAADGTDDPASTQQKRQVHSLLDGLGTDTVMGVLTEAFDLSTFGGITSAQADAVLRVGDEMGTDALHAAWRGWQV